MFEYRICFSKVFSFSGNDAMIELYSRAPIICLQTYIMAYKITNIPKDICPELNIRSPFAN